jgi:hypothetical protein
MDRLKRFAPKGEECAKARAARGALVVGMALACGLIVGLSPRDAAPARIAVLVAIACGFISAVLAGRGRQRRSAGAWVASAAGSVTRWRSQRLGMVVTVAAWVVVLGAIAAWDFVSFLMQRHDLPTLSRLIGYVSLFGWGRGLLAGAWFIWGAWCAFGDRRPRS